MRGKEDSKRNFELISNIDFDSIYYFFARLTVGRKIMAEVLKFGMLRSHSLSAPKYEKSQSPSFGILGPPGWT